LSRGSLKRSQSSSFKNPDDEIYWIGKRDRGLIGSEYAEHFLISDEEMSILDVDMEMNLALYRRIKTGLELGLFHSIHDISDGGVLCALAECCFGNMMGIQITLPEISNVCCFSEGTGQFVVSIPTERRSEFESLLGGLSFLHLGKVTDSKHFIVENAMDEKVSDLISAWTRSF